MCTSQHIKILDCLSPNTVVSLLLISSTYRKYTQNALSRAIDRSQPKWQQRCDIRLFSFFFSSCFHVHFILSVRCIAFNMHDIAYAYTKRFFRSSAVNNAISKADEGKKIVYQIIIRIITIFLYFEFHYSSHIPYTHSFISICVSVFHSIFFSVP